MKKAFRNIFLFFVLLTSLSGQVNAQDNSLADSISEKVLFYFEKQYGVQVMNRGFGAFYNIARHKNGFQKTVWEIDFQTLKAINEYRDFHNNISQYQQRKIVFGKDNYAVIIRGGYYRNKLLNDKPYWGGVDIRYFYGGGVDLGISIPIYYDYDMADGMIRTARFSREYATNGTILSKASFFKGIGESGVHPGLHVKAGFCFDFSKYNQMIRSLDGGVIIDGFAIPFKIMHGSKGEYVVPSFFIRLGFGNKYN